MSVEACADLVERADPDRFLATMAAPPEFRADFFALFAFNIEVSRAPYVTAEPLIAQMRLQWWLDALDEIEQGGLVRNHEVTLPLAQTVQAHGLSVARFRDMVEARRHDIDGAPFASLDQLWDYVDRATGGLILLAAQCVGAEVAQEHAQSGVQAFARADAIARYLRAAPEIEARGKTAMPEDITAQQLANTGLEQIKTARDIGVAKPVRPALWSGWWAEDYLRRIAAGNPGQRSPFAHKMALLYRSTLHRF